LKKPNIREDTIRETCLVAGFLLLEVGIWIIYQPAAFIMGGLLLMWLGIPERREK
jgi:hypothetical protein